MSLETFLMDVWDLSFSFAIMFALLGFWYIAVSNVTPFAHVYTPSEIEKEKERETRYVGIRKFSVRMDLLFFVWLVLEGMFLVPYLFIRYGMAP